MFSPYRPSVVSVCYDCRAEQVLLVAVITKIDSSILLFFFRQLNETSQPI
jgi:hypothetical protein